MTLEEWFVRRVILYLLGVILVIVLVSGVVGYALAQDPHKTTNHWYDYACCHERDCRPARPGEVVADPEKLGWRAYGQIIAWDDLYRNRASKDPNDKRVHICLTPDNRVLCIYTPQAGG